TVEVVAGHEERGGPGGAGAEPGPVHDQEVVAGDGRGPLPDLGDPQGDGAAVLHADRERTGAVPLRDLGRCHRRHRDGRPPTPAPDAAPARSTDASNAPMPVRRVCAAYGAGSTAATGTASRPSCGRA